jgi:hypothetical protein
MNTAIWVLIIVAVALLILILANYERLVARFNENRGLHFRFKLRDMFWVVLVVALAFGWWNDHRIATDGAETMLEQQSKLHKEAFTALQNAFKREEDFNRRLGEENWRLRQKGDSSKQAASE